jgi:hypothetical protein
MASQRVCGADLTKQIRGICEVRSRYTVGSEWRDPNGDGPRYVDQNQWRGRFRFASSCIHKMSVRVHETFFFENIVVQAGIVILAFEIHAHATVQVEETLYQVPRSLLMGSAVFRDMFTLPKPGKSDGQSKERPLKLEGVAADDFTLFVRASLARCACPHERRARSLMRG